MGHALKRNKSGGHAVLYAGFADERDHGAMSTLACHPHSHLAAQASLFPVASRAFGQTHTPEQTWLLAPGANLQTLCDQHGQPVAQIHRQRSARTGTDIGAEWLAMFVQLPFANGNHAAVQPLEDAIDVVQQARKGQWVFGKVDQVRRIVLAMAG